MPGWRPGAPPRAHDKHQAVGRLRKRNPERRVLLGSRHLRCSYALVIQVPRLRTHDGMSVKKKVAVLFV